MIKSIVWEAQTACIIDVFGTGKGLSEELLARCDYLLVPVEGLTIITISL